MQSLPWDTTHTQLHLTKAQGESIHQTHAHLSSESPQQLSLLKPELLLSTRQPWVWSNPREQPHTLTSRCISRAVTCSLLWTAVVEQIPCAYKEDASLGCRELALLPGAVSPTINHSVWDSCWPPRHQLLPCAQHICSLCPDSCSAPAPLPFPTLEEFSSQWCIIEEPNDFVFHQQMANRM